jgi:uncharacterized protein (DUF697 family)
MLGAGSTHESINAMSLVLGLEGNGRARRWIRLRNRGHSGSICGARKRSPMRHILAGQRYHDEGRMQPFWAKLGGQFSQRWRAIRQTVLNPTADTAEDVLEAARAQAPVIWLLGMVGTGKSSVIRTLTGSSDAEVGSGFRPCTATSRVFDFPPEAPVVRFLDTRGLGEVNYDPDEDLALCESQAHLVVAVLRATDPLPPGVLGALTQIRRRHSDWPVVVAQTTLHDAYPGKAHPQPYPFGDDGTTPSGIATLDRSLAAQRVALRALPGKAPIRFAPIDFTRPEDGLSPADYGIDTLWSALEHSAIEGFIAMLRRGARGDALERRAHAHVQGYAVAAGAIDLLPVAGAIGVPVVQGKMLHSLASLYALSWSRRTLTEFSASLGVGTLLHQGGLFGVRQLVKLIPGAGQVLGAASASALSFIVTYGLGHAAMLYLQGRRQGESPQRAAIVEEFQRAMAEAGLLAKSGRLFERGDGSDRSNRQEGDG